MTKYQFITFTKKEHDEILDNVQYAYTLTKEKLANVPEKFLLRWQKGYTYRIKET